MKKPDIEDYLQEGVYGSRETKPGERKLYLGTLRERIVIALTKGELMQQHGTGDLAEHMKQHEDATLLLNGEVSYRFLSPYMDIAEENGIHHSIISNQESESQYGAVLTLDYAIEKEHIRIENEEKEEVQVSGGFKSFFKSLFGAKK